MSYAAAIPVLQREWGMSGAQAGAVASGLQIGYAASLVICSSLADRVSARSVYIGSLFATAVCAMAFALLARGFFSALVLNTIVGVSLGGGYTTCVMILADQYAPSSRGMAVGWFVAATSCGYALSLAVSGAALPVGGYQLSFLLTCLGPVLGWVLAWVTLRHTRVAVAPRGQGQRFSREVLGNRRAMLLIWGYTAHNWELQGMWSWTPAFMAACLTLAGSSVAGSAGWAAHMTALFHVMGLLACFTMGGLSDRMGRARVILCLAAISGVCSLVFGWTVGWPLAVVIVIGTIYAFSSLGDSPVLSAALTESVESAYLGAALGLRSLLGFGAAAVSPLVFGAILDWTNPSRGLGQGQYMVWGWAFSALGLGGLGAVWAAHRYNILARESRDQRSREGAP
jgi:MFS family permease